MRLRGVLSGGETEECINGVALTTGVYFGENVDKIVDRLLEDRLDDGGWNCWREYGASVSSFHTTICVLEGLLAWEQQHELSADVASARQADEEYLLDRHLFRSRTTGEVVDPRFTMFSFPYYWYYDVLRALDHFRSSRAGVDAMRRSDRPRGRKDGRDGSVAVGKLAPGTNSFSSRAS